VLSSLISDICVHCWRETNHHPFRPGRVASAPHGGDMGVLVPFIGERQDSVICSRRLAPSGGSLSLAAAGSSWAAKHRWVHPLHLREGARRAPNARPRVNAAECGTWDHPAGMRVREAGSAVIVSCRDVGAACQGSAQRAHGGTGSRHREAVPTLAEPIAEMAMAGSIDERSVVCNWRGRLSMTAPLGGGSNAPCRPAEMRAWDGVEGSARARQRVRRHSMDLPSAGRCAGHLTRLEEAVEGSSVFV
jgi:hypothetical protein